MVNEKSLENLSKGKRFSSEYRPKHSGRRKSLLKLIDDNRVSLSDLKNVMDSLLSSYSFYDIEKIYSGAHENVPVFVSLILKALIKDIKNGSLDTLEFIMDRVYGKSTNTNIIDVQCVDEDVKNKITKMFSTVFEVSANSSENSEQVDK